MKKISWVTHPQYDIPLPKNHKFTSSKFSDLYNELHRIGLSKHADIFVPEKASVKDLTLVHEQQYIEKIKNGTLENHEERRLGLKWSPELANRSFLAVNGTFLTTIKAIEKGVACHIAGGTHHSHYNFGSGYCVFNDLAYSSMHLINKGFVNKILIFDCDVHQGDGTASILNSHSNIFTCSIHCKNNFPARKSISNLDVELGDNLNSEQYLAILNETLNNCMKQFEPDLVIYDAGVDIHKNDELGKLDVDDQGLLLRDETVLSFFKELSIPIATVIGGGYSKDNMELAKRHSTVFKAAKNIFL
tara:strand:+ start:89 stop:997 length:909 start_codon:yes stop_codon:yes gene_type:complete